MDFLIMTTVHEGLRDSVVKHISRRFSHLIITVEMADNRGEPYYQIYARPPLFGENDEELWTIKRDADIIRSAFLDGVADTQKRLFKHMEK